MTETTKVKGKAVPTEPEIDPSLLVEEVSTEEIASYLATSEPTEPVQVAEPAQKVQPQPQVATVVLQG